MTISGNRESGIGNREETEEFRIRSVDAIATVSFPVPKFACHATLAIVDAVSWDLSGTRFSPWRRYGIDLGQKATLREWSRYAIATFNSPVSKLAHPYTFNMVVGESIAALMECDRICFTRRILMLWGCTIKG
ncbi:MAG: hypothetical protein F6K26_30215 [Moorea sp. SIO2I5]|nr:hypothetical protein [Moorena sp. SIO2I5]